MRLCPYDGWSVTRVFLYSFLSENHRGSQTLTLLNVFNALNVLNMLKDHWLHWPDGPCYTAAPPYSGIVTHRLTNLHVAL